MSRLEIKTEREWALQGRAVFASELDFPRGQDDYGVDCYDEAQVSVGPDAANPLTAARGTIAEEQLEVATWYADGDREWDGY